MKKLIHIDIDDVLNSKTPEPKVVKNLFFSTYKEAMNENKYGKLMGIMIPIYLISMIVALFLQPGLLSTIIIITSSCFYLVSYILLVSYRHKKEIEKLNCNILDSFEEIENK